MHDPLRRVASSTQKQVAEFVSSKMAENDSVPHTTAVGKLQAAANTTYRLEFFDNPSSAGAQGKVFLGFINVITDASGTALFTADFGVAGTFLTATATDPTGNTSTFSKSVGVQLL